MSGGRGLTAVLPRALRDESGGRDGTGNSEVCALRGETLRRVFGGRDLHGVLQGDINTCAVAGGPAGRRHHAHLRQDVPRLFDGALGEGAEEQSEAYTILICGSGGKGGSISSSTSSLFTSVMSEEPQVGQNTTSVSTSWTTQLM